MVYILYNTPATAGAGTYYIKGTTAGGCSSVTAVTVIPVQPHFQLFIDPTFASLPWEGLPY